jgi:hypothetical protein
VTAYSTADRRTREPGSQDRIRTAEQHRELAADFRCATALRYSDIRHSGMISFLNIVGRASQTFADISLRFIQSKLISNQARIHSCSTAKPAVGIFGRVKPSTKNLMQLPAITGAGNRDDPVKRRDDWHAGVMRYSVRGENPLDTTGERYCDGQSWIRNLPTSQVQYPMAPHRCWPRDPLFTLWRGNPTG